MDNLYTHPYTAKLFAGHGLVAFVFVASLAIVIAIYQVFYLERCLRGPFLPGREGVDWRENRVN
jgi:hypothetical protein